MLILSRKTNQRVPVGVGRGIVVSLQAGMPKTLVEPGGRPWTTGFIKDTVKGPAWLGKSNLAGDGQADSVHHGGVDKAVCAYPADHYSFWKSDLCLANLSFGGFGENFTLAGLTEVDVCIGDIWKVDDAVVQVSQPRQPCWKLARRWNIKDLASRVQQTGRTGWYFRVLREGFVERERKISLAERLHPDWTVANANRTMHEDQNNLADARALASLPELSASWRETLMRRIQRRVEPSSDRRLFGEE